MPLTKTTNRMTSGAYPNVSDFGAVGGGSIDDSSAVIAAVNSAVADGTGYIYIPFSSIKITSCDMQNVGIIGNGTSIANTTGMKNVGRIKNCLVRGYSTDENQIGYTYGGGLHKKVVYRKSSSVLSVLMKRRGRGYVESEHWYNSYGTASTDTAGSSENWRQCVTRYISEVYLYKHTADDETASAWGSSTNIVLTQSFPTGTASAIQLQYRSTGTLNAEIAWNVNAEKVGQVGYVGIYSTAGSTNQFELYVNGTLQGTYSATLVGTQYILPVKYTLDQSGTNEVRLKKTGANALNVIGAEFWTLDEYPGNRTVEDIAYGDYDEDYVDNNGASDYALFSVAEQKWFGSYHGGETKRSDPSFFLDSVSETIPATTGDFLVGDHVLLQQKTTIAVGSDTMDVDSDYTYYEDSMVKFDCTMEGSCTVDKAYTCMSATSARFQNVSYPDWIQTLSSKNLLGRCNTVTQVNRSDPSFPLNLTVQFTLFPMGGVTGANMTANGPYISSSASYNKLYYGPVTDSETDLTKLSYSTTRLFE